MTEPADRTGNISQRQTFVRDDRKKIKITADDHRCFSVMQTKIGKITLLASEEYLLEIYLSEFNLSEFKNTENRQNRVIKEAIRQLSAYFDQKLTVFDLPLKMNGTEFQNTVWTELKKIPYAETISYSELANRIGNKKACRAVGMANSKNPFSIVVPCHRVIGANGTLTGYAGGLHLKRELLNFEMRANLF